MIISHGPLIKTLSAIIVKSKSKSIQNCSNKILVDYKNIVCEETQTSLQMKNLKISFKTSNRLYDKEFESDFEKNSESVNEELGKNNCEISSFKEVSDNEQFYFNDINDSMETNEYFKNRKKSEKQELNKADSATETLKEIKYLSVTDEEKELRLALESPSTYATSDYMFDQNLLSDKPFLETVFNSLQCSENDYVALFALCFIYALVNNQVKIQLSLVIKLILI